MTNKPIDKGDSISTIVAGKLIIKNYEKVVSISKRGEGMITLTPIEIELLMTWIARIQEKKKILKTLEKYGNEEDKNIYMR